MFAAYAKYSRSLGFEAELLHSDYGHIVAKICGKNVGQAFKNEPGKHIVQRIPVTESKGRKQTSVVCVAVLPIKEDVADILVESELRIEAVNLGGPGGQHQNRTLSGCRITHIPTGLKATINSRDYHANEREARRILAARVNEARKEAVDADYAVYRKEQMQGGSRSGKLRTYNFLRGKINDHRLNTCISIKEFEKGRMYKLWQREKN